MFNLSEFINKLIPLKDEFCIETSYKRSGETVSRRIAILVNDFFLECGGDIHWASVLERKIYETVKDMNFTCETTPHELNWDESRKKAANKTHNPLKLGLDRLDKHLGYHPMIVYLTNQIIEILLQKEDRNDVGRKNREHFERKTVERTFSRQLIHSQ